MHPGRRATLSANNTNTNTLIHISLLHDKKKIFIWLVINVVNVCNE